MPDISALNGTAIDNVAEFDGLTVTDVPTFVGLLDETYGSGAAAGYSTRRLASATTVLLRVRRETGTGNDGNDDEADVGYDSNNELSLDSPVSNFSAAGSNATTLGEFLNVGTVNSITYTDADSLSPNTAAAYVDEWKDQSGNGNDAEQTTPANQPQIHSGTVDTDLITENGKPIIKNNPTSSARNALDFSVNFTNDSWLFAVCLVEESFSAIIEGATANDFIALAQSGSGLSCNAGATNVVLYKDGASWSATTRDNVYDDLLNNQSLIAADFDASWTSGYIGYGSSPSVNLQPVQEFIIWTSDQSSNRPAIEGNVNAHFQIGNFGTPTSGLLFDYPDAAAAYSVRQLANTAALSMRVRRDTAGGTGDDDEADVLFDFTLTDPTISLDSRINNASTGVASTTLGEFLNATGYTDVDNLTVVADGFCDTWYDQSGAGNDAEQTVPGSQPQIFDSASPTDLITENGKPFLKFRGGNSGNESLTMGSSVTAETMFSVVANDTPGFLAYYIWSSGALGFFSGGTISGYTGPGVASGASVGYIVGTETGQTLLYNDHNGTGWEVGQDGGTASQVLVTGAKSIDQVVRPSTNLQVEKFQEIIIYDTDKSGHRTGIETDINDFFSIT